MLEDKHLRVSKHSTYLRTYSGTSSTLLGPTWLSCIERYRHFRGRFVLSSMWLGLPAVSSLERFLLSRVSFIQRFHCIDTRALKPSTTVLFETSLEFVCKLLKYLQTHRLKFKGDGLPENMSVLQAVKSIWCGFFCSLLY